MPMLISEKIGNASYDFQFIGPKYTLILIYLLCTLNIYFKEQNLNYLQMLNNFCITSSYNYW